MLSFLIRMVLRAATVQKYKFIGLTLTIAVSSALLVILSALYLNAESRLKHELSGIPNFIVEPQQAIVNLTQLTSDDVAKLKSQDHFWRNNIVNAVPLQRAQVTLNGKPVEAAGTWFEKQVSVENEIYRFGILKFTGWQYSGSPPDDRSVILGSAVKGDLQTGQTVDIRLGDVHRSFLVAGFLETGSFWDHFIFFDLNELSRLTGKATLDQILVSALIKPKDALAVRAEVYGSESLTSQEYEAWFCSPYAASIVASIQQVLPHSSVHILRRITEVQEGIIRASGAVFVALLLLTLVAATMAIFSAEKMYVASKLRDFGIMAALGANMQKSFLLLMLEIGLASIFAMALTYFISGIAVERISTAVFSISLTAKGTLLLGSAVLPLVLAILTAFILVKKNLQRNVVQNLR